MSDLERAFAFQLRAAKVRAWETEYKFHPDRNWRFDFAWLPHEHPLDDLTGSVFTSPGVAVEIEGGTRSGGRHVRGQGFENDCEKYAEALLLGWSVLRVTGAMVEDGRALAYLERLL